MEDATQVQGQLSDRGRGSKTHSCSRCNFPICVYGRCAPCLHTFCLACAADMATCFICAAPITKLETVHRNTANLFISPATLQSFRTEAELAKHVQQLQQTLGTRHDVC